ncbi:MAG: peptidylprolyl isomerase [Clostridia bacterium]|nr:peptidylprolyl isomerase [Clostridia bacterium]
MLAVCVMCLSACADSSGTDSAAAPAATEAAAESAAAESPAADTSGTILADIDIADYGTVTVELDPEAAPATVENFVKLAREGFYDGLTFHRIMEGFMMQGGDPDGNGTGGSDETIVGEFSQNGHDNPISHVRGTISMARSNDPDSASSQFFIVQADSLFLDGAYAGFGHVVDGMDVVDAICADAQPVDNNGTIPADAQPVITSVTIRE